MYNWLDIRSYENISVLKSSNCCSWSQISSDCHGPCLMWKTLSMDQILFRGSSAPTIRIAEWVLTHSAKPNCCAKFQNKPLSVCTFFVCATNVLVGPISVMSLSTIIIFKPALCPQCVISSYNFRLVISQNGWLLWHSPDELCVVQLDSPCDRQGWRSESLPAAQESHLEHRSTNTRVHLSGIQGHLFLF